MKAISLWQPWASLVAIGAKTFETRSWYTPHRGPLLICSAKKWNKKLAAIWRSEPFDSMLPPVIFFGQALCIVDLVEVYVVQHPVEKGHMMASDGKRKEIPTDNERAFGDYSAGRFAWEFKNLRSFGDRKFDVIGRQGIFNVEIGEEYEHEFLRQDRGDLAGEDRRPQEKHLPQRQHRGGPSEKVHAARGVRPQPREYKRTARSG